MKYLVLILLLTGCASFSNEDSLRTLASFDLGCLPEEIEIIQVAGKIYEAKCENRNQKYFRVCFPNHPSQEKECTWMKTRKVK